MNYNFLDSVQLTHVLNAAEGNKDACVNTNAEFYRPRNIKYLGLRMFDVPQTNIAKHFYTASDFIQEALDSGGKVLVHCLMGMSRSASLVIAFLMIHKQMSVKEAFREVKKTRDVRPKQA